MRGRPKLHREYELLSVLRNDPRMSIQEMCDAMGIKAKSHVHGLLKKLEDEGLIQREPNLSRSVSIGGVRLPRSEMKARHAPKYSKTNYEKKTAAGKQGRGTSALQSKSAKRQTEAARIEMVVARAKAMEANGGYDVIHDHRNHFYSGRVHAVKIG